MKGEVFLVILLFITLCSIGQKIEVKNRHFEIIIRKNPGLL